MLSVVSEAASEGMLFSAFARRRVFTQPRPNPDIALEQFIEQFMGCRACRAAEGRAVLYLRPPGSRAIARHQIMIGTDFI
jgi:hypothetical protein